MTLSLSSEPQARSLTDRETQERNEGEALWAKRMSGAYISVREVRGQVPGTTCNGARAKSAINNYQALCYIRAERKWRAGVSSGTPEWTTRVEYPKNLEYPWNSRVAEDPLPVVLDQVRRHRLASQCIKFSEFLNSESYAGVYHGVRYRYGRSGNCPTRS